MLCLKTNLSNVKYIPLHTFTYMIVGCIPILDGWKEIRRRLNDSLITAAVKKFADNPFIDCDKIARESENPTWLTEIDKHPFVQYNQVNHSSGNDFCFIIKQTMDSYSIMDLGGGVFINHKLIPFQTWIPFKKNELIRYIHVHPSYFSNVNISTSHHTFFQSLPPILAQNFRCMYEKVDPIKPSDVILDCIIQDDRKRKECISTDTNKTKKRCTAFNNFSSTVKDSINKELDQRGDLKHIQYAIEISKRWKLLTKEEKEAFQSK